MYTDKNETREEWLPLVHAEGNVIGKETRSRCHNGSRKLHPVVHLHVVDSEGRIYLQLRPEWKTVQPGKWDTAVGGHVDFGETVGEALIREAYEELNLSGFTPEPLEAYEFESETERELVYPFLTAVNYEPSPSPELAGGRFWTRAEIDDAIGKGLLTPNFEKEYLRIWQNAF